MTKFCSGNRWTLATLAATLMVSSAAFAQQATNSDPYSGVSQPPPDGTIVANPDVVANPPAQPAPSQAAKPSPDVPAAAPATSPEATTTPASESPASATAAAPGSNPDYDIVTSIPGQSASSPELQTRPNPDDGIVSAIPSGASDLAEGTNIRIRLTEKLSTKETSVGAPFKGEVTNDVSKDGHVIIPTGSELKGHVIGVSQGHHFGVAATLRLRPDVVILPDGTAYHLYAQVAGSEAPGTRTDSEGGIQPKSHLVKNAVEYGAAAGTGAVVGGYVGGPAGALVGSVVGAGVVTAHMLMQHPDAAVVPKGAIVTFSLTEPMELTPTRN
ncbi:MAG TPA: hypothetical protein VHT28_09400 [Silvibacterium sp.]|jgi:hypothetical protein|nr:hypothetical protein [Silvibacterium sp.]